MLGITRGQYQYVYTDPPAMKQICFTGKLEEIYDLQTDPGETRDISLSHPDLLEFFQNERRTYEDRAREFRKSKLLQNPSPRIHPDEDVQEQICAPGYLQ